jgi:hypothetical protein
METDDKIRGFCCAFHAERDAAERRERRALLFVGLALIVLVLAYLMPRLLA